MIIIYLVAFNAAKVIKESGVARILERPAGSNKYAGCRYWHSIFYGEITPVKE